MLVLSSSQYTSPCSPVALNDYCACVRARIIPARAVRHGALRWTTTACVRVMRVCACVRARDVGGMVHVPCLAMDAGSSATSRSFKMRSRSTSRLTGETKARAAFSKRCRRYTAHCDTILLFIMGKFRCGGRRKVPTQHPKPVQKSAHVAPLPH